ncbi:phage terminase large subunit [Paenibacillus naphthalenovorans]|uniref:phage terminase large subunit n=1 Tax=Paenibacillus naphthalenovorans TaxID=162209 RepID=UPI003D28952A
MSSVPRSVSRNIQSLPPEVIWQAALEDARQDLGWFGEMVWRDDTGKPVRPARHHELWIAALSDESLNRLLIVAPPEHAKTVWCSQIWSAWQIGRNPNMHLLHVTVTATLSKLNSVAVRDTVEGNEIYREIFPDTKPDRVKGWGEGEWFLWRDDRGDKDATFAAAGFDGPIIGRRAHVVLVDDPHSEDTASSPTYRERTKRRFRRQVMSRLSKTGRAVMVTTRWHHDDIAADLIKDREGGWVTIHTPALSEYKEGEWEEEAAFALVLSWDRQKLEGFVERLAALGFEPEEIGAPPENWGYSSEMFCSRVKLHDKSRALWPERWPEEALEQRKRDVGSNGWHSMYQGKGTPPEGKIFKSKDFRYYEDMGDHYLLHPGDDKPQKKVLKRDIIRIIQYCDPAATEESRSDFFALSTWGLTRDGDALWLDLHHDKYEVPKQPAVLEQNYLKHKPERVVLEAKSAGLALFQTMKNHSGIPIAEDKPDKSKVARAGSAAVHYENHRVYHPASSTWISKAEEELLGFPDEAPHDDIVDTVSGGLNELFLNKPPSRVAPSGVGTTSYWRRS